MHDILPTPFLRDLAAAIIPPDPALGDQARSHWDQLTKPPGSLGRLEEIGCKLAMIQGGLPVAARPARIYTIAADHGVVEEGVAAFPKEVTRQMVRNFLQEGAGVNALCRSAGVELRVVDAGVSGPPLREHPLLINARIRPGTANLAREAAMSMEECVRAVEMGAGLAAQAASEGIRAIGLGEMGIGNTTPSTALFCAYLGFSPAEMTGPGAGAPLAGLGHKASVIARSLKVHAGTIASGNPLAILAALGGLEIAALTGLILGSAARNLAVMVDGFISTAAYVAALGLAPAVREHCFFSHASAETGHARVLEKLGQRPLLDLGLRLGEGTGAALGLFLLEAAANTSNSMATFEAAGIRT